MSLGEVRSDADGFAILSDRLVKLALLVQRITEIGVSLGEIGFDADGLAICGDRLFQFALVVQRHPKVRKINRMCIASYSLTDQLDRQVIAPRLLCKQTKQMESIRMLRLSRQHLSITSLGLGQACRLVVFQSRR